jgi:hypothetical protein
MALSTETCSQVKKALNVDGLAVKHWLIASDLLRSEGVTASSVGAGGKHREEIKERIVIPSLSKAEQALLQASIKVLSKTKKDTRREVQQKIGSRLAKIAFHLRKNEAVESRTPRMPSTLEATLRRDLSKLIKKVKDAEKVSFSATNMIKCLSEALALIKIK